MRQHIQCIHVLFYVVVQSAVMKHERVPIMIRRKLYSSPQRSFCDSCLVVADLSRLSTSSSVNEDLSIWVGNI